MVGWNTGVYIERARAFGWNAIEIDGHDVEEIDRAYREAEETKGRPTVVGYTAGDVDTWSDVMARCLACMGARPGDIVHNAYGYGLFTGGLGAHYGAERLGCTVVPMSGGGTERQVTLLQDFAANVLCATPSYALNIAEVATSMGVDLRQSSLRIGVFGAEPARVLGVRRGCRRFQPGWRSARGTS